MSYLDFDKSDRRKNSQKIIIKIISWILILAVVIVLGYLTVKFSIEKTVMSGNSMNETLQDGDKIIVSRLSYLFKEPKRFDVIVFKQGGTEHGYYNIKRIIGLPGESVQIIDGSVYINGNILEEIINVELINIPGLAEDVLTLEEDEYFVLGDSRNDSEDSRFANIGNVIKSDIIGKAFIRTKPSLSIISQNNLKKAEKSLQEDNTEDSVN